MKAHRIFLILILIPLSETLYSQSENDESIAGKTALFLKKAQLPDGSFQDSTNALFNVWETILVTNALLDGFPESDSSIQRSLAWLKNQENQQQLVCHNQQCRDQLCVETSVLYLQLLNRLSDRQNLTQRITQLTRLQEKNGSWKVLNPDVQFQTDFPSVTAFMLNLLPETSELHTVKKAGYNYLISKQLPDGSWGQTWEYYNCPGYALWQCTKALHKNPELFSEKEKAKRFILSNQLENGSWYNEDVSSFNRISPQLQTALMLHCLLTETDSASVAAFTKGMNFLLKTQLPDGSWDGGFFPIPNARYKKREYLFATALIYQLLLVTQSTGNHE